MITSRPVFIVNNKGMKLLPYLSIKTVSSPSSFLMTVLQLLAVGPGYNLWVLYPSALFPFSLFHRCPYFSINLLIKSAPLNCFL